MIKKYISFTLICLLLITANSAVISAQTRSEKDDTSVAKIKEAVAKISTGKNKRITVKKKDGAKLKGNVGQMDEDSFTMTDSKTNQSVEIAYSDVSKVTGRSANGNKIALIVGISAAAAGGIILGILLLKRCENEGGCL